MNTGNLLYSVLESGPLYKHAENGLLNKHPMAVGYLNMASGLPIYFLINTVI